MRQIRLPDARAGRGQAKVGDRGIPLPAVVRAQRYHGRRDLLADRDPVRLCRAVRDGGEVGGIVAV
jgi:hypothetical protein